ncbi:MAG TPA: cyclic nucleotide-binding domain-containing protein, partial [Ferruginibacter sp.]|nr:cyclic nucleotide-binding domain-containing protein [Ferruginibacter sp.]
MQQLFEQIGNYHRLSPEAAEAVSSGFERVTLPKNECLVTEGKVCRHLYFLEKGALRGYYQEDGKEITHWFGFENDFVTSFHSFITG